MTRNSALTVLMLSTVVVCGFAGISGAATDDHDVVRTRTGAVVGTMMGTCVRTRWEVGADACGTKVVQQEQTIQETHRRPRTAIAQEDRTIYFGFNQATLTPESKQKLNSLANVLKSEEDVKEAKIVGYADRIGSASYNEKLSEKRAENVRRYLITQGVINASVAETRWLGESVPVTNCPNTLVRPALIQCLQRDRRVEVEINYLPEDGVPDQR